MVRCGEESVSHQESSARMGWSGVQLTLLRNIIEFKPRMLMLGFKHCLSHSVAC